mgnify:CR=1 FL=1
MRKYTKIYLDMDGVISNFMKRYEELYHEFPDRHTNSKEFGENFENFIKTGNFATLDLMPDAKALLSYLRTLKVPIEILSSTGMKKNHTEVSRQKEIWLNKHKIAYPTNFVAGKQLKKNYADATSIIIDDTPSVIEQWRQAGGVAILHTDADTTIAILGTLLA